MALQDAHEIDGIFFCRMSSLLKVSFAKETYKRDDILQKRPIISLCVAYMYHGFIVRMLMRFIIESCVYPDYESGI
jgi:hypothetical protein